MSKYNILVEVWDFRMSPTFPLRPSIGLGEDRQNDGAIFFAHVLNFRTCFWEKSLNFKTNVLHCSVCSCNVNDKLKESSRRQKVLSGNLNSFINIMQSL